MGDYGKVWRGRLRSVLGGKRQVRRGHRLTLRHARNQSVTAHTQQEASMRFRTLTMAAALMMVSVAAFAQCPPGQTLVGGACQVVGGAVGAAGTVAGGAVNAAGNVAGSAVGA